LIDKALLGWGIATRALCQVSDIRPEWFLALVERLLQLGFRSKR
jgi:hypothetical protein